MANGRGLWLNFIATSADEISRAAPLQTLFVRAGGTPVHLPNLIFKRKIGDNADGSID